MSPLPIGSIVMWFGSLATIPPGYALCDGNNDTPDLRDRFVIGSGDTFDPDDTGGSLTHTHPFTGDGHVHVIAPGPNLDAGTFWKTVTESTAVTGTTDPGSNLPPYHALAYLMFVGP